MKQNVYEVQKNIEKLLRGGMTGFLTGNVLNEVKSKLKKGSYSEYIPFEEAEKIILYTSNVPNVRLFKISCYKDDTLKHSNIMGSLFGLNITSEMFGDIIKVDNDFYVYLLEDIVDLVINEFKMVGNIPITLEEISINLLEDFKREYEEIELIVSSLRIDTIVSKLAKCTRDSVEEKVRNKEIIVNDIEIKKANTIISINDVFSIRRCGKYKFKEIVGKTKKDNYIIKIDKYI